MKTSRRSRNAPDTRRRLLDATTRLMLRQGFAATSVDQICAEASLTKGSFFHHFPNKEAIGLEAMADFAQRGMELYAAASAEVAEPLSQLYRLFEIMAELAREHGERLSCMVGMLSQELGATNPTLREACAGHMNAWVEMVAGMLARAKQARKPAIDFEPEAVAWMLYGIWQGSMLIGKTRSMPELVASNLRQGRAYVDLLFGSRPDAGSGRSARRASKRREAPRRTRD